MNRADQHVLLQETNLGVLDIRQSELDYRIDLNTAFGTQAALIGGFSYGVYSQNPLNENTTYSGTFLDLYWAVSAVTIACAIHIILTTMTLQVLGPGLALNGPVGSMAKANDGLRIEQQPVVISFLIMMIFFAISTVLGFWSTFNFYPALISTVIFVVACRYWYVYTERIYCDFIGKNPSHDGMSMIAILSSILRYRFHLEILLRAKRRNQFCDSSMFRASSSEQVSRNKLN
jgi:hypothetical protein